MAAKKTSSQKKRVNTKKKTGAKAPQISEKKGTPVAAEIFVWVMLIFCVILFLSNVFGIGGKAGKAVSAFFFGEFGVVAYVMPFVFFGISAFLVANRGKKEAWTKTAILVILVFCICCFAELISGEYDASRTLTDYFYAGMEMRSGGGIAGGLFCRAFCSVFGLVGAWIINIGILLIFTVLLTGYSLFDGIRKGSGRAHEQSSIRRELNKEKRRNLHLQKQMQMQTEIEQLRDANEGLQEEIRKPRRERIVTGVSMATTFDQNLPKTAEVHEVTPRRRKRTDSVANKKASDAKIPDPKIAEPIVPEETKEAEADTVSPVQQPQQMDMSFTIQRNGISKVVSADKPFTAAEQELADHEVSAEELVKENCAVPEEKVPKSQNSRSAKEEQQKAVESVASEIKETQSTQKQNYTFPPLDLLTKPSGKQSGSSDAQLQETAAKLQQILHNFGVNVTVTNVCCGPAVTRYELTPEMGVKVSKIVALADDIKLYLAASDIRIEAPISGKSAVGIEVPNKTNSAVYLRELLETQEFQNAKSNLSFAVGKDISGKPVVADIAKMPHLLIAGATGSGKSVCINTLIMSILYKANPEDVKLIMIDPKVVELSVYNGIPHLYIPVVTDPKKASGALNWAVAEMMERYQKFAQCGARDVHGYNQKIQNLGDVDGAEKPKKLPQIVIIVDELADLMMVAPGEVEDAICRLAQLARAAGIHLIIATQRPSVNVITGLIKANMPSRIAFAVTSGVDSRTILDMNGAEKLLGKGDMLFHPYGNAKPIRVQGSFVSDAEVSAVTEFLTKQNDENYTSVMEERMSKVQQSAPVISDASSGGNDRDTFFVDAGKFIIEKDKASIGMLQRVFKIGFNRAARIMDQLSEAGVVGPEEGTKPRKILMSMEEFEQYIDEYV
ncbi:MAG: DNA translocase FtsK 4TM domain-containing protein [Muricoprocola sp.]